MDSFIKTKIRALKARIFSYLDLLSLVGIFYLRDG